MSLVVDDLNPLKGSLVVSSLYQKEQLIYLQQNDYKLQVAIQGVIDDSKW